MQLEGGIVLPKTFGHIAHGYVDTSHASQGKTVKRVFIAVGDESLKAANRAQWYVSVSRGELSARIYTEDAGALKAAIQKSPERMSVSEMMRGEPPVGDDPVAKKQRPRLDMRRLARFLKDRMQDAYDAITSRGPWQQRALQREVRHEQR